MKTTLGDNSDVAPTPKTLWNNALSILDFEHYQDDFNSPEFCHQRVVGKNNYDKPIKNHFNSRFKYGLTTAAVLKCVMVTDLITTPYSIVQQLTRYLFLFLLSSIKSIILIFNNILK